MTQVELLQLMHMLARRHNKKVFFLKEIAAWGGETRAAAAMTLLRAAKKGLVGRVGNLWFNLLDPPELLEVALSLVSPAYLSFESALYRRGALSQSPRGELTLATSRRPRRFATPLGVIRYIHLKSGLFFGFGADRIASAEKAWLDLIYIRGRQGRRALVSERFYPKRLRAAKLRKMGGPYPAWVKELIPAINAARRE